ncbi:MAG TPA: peptidoglycan DD-metalloendopeptidase family protein [Solirubrobacteraceae bacterium]|nr:peptidoglycan DD-metalloendopeptidase family protein [Solirubrobacteraceae bacterium]
MRRRACCLGLLVALTLGGLLLLGGPAGARSSQGNLGAARRAAQRLHSKIGRQSRQIAKIGGSVAHVRSQLARIQADLHSKRLQLARTRGQLRRARAHLALLEADLAQATRALTDNVVQAYKSGRPDVITVIVESHGFADLLEKVDFLKRAQKQDTKVVETVRAARIRVAAAATALGNLEARQQSIAEQIRSRRDQIDRLKIGLLKRQAQLERSRHAKRRRLQAVTSRIRSLRKKLGRSRPAGLRGSVGGTLHGGGFTFPMPAGAGAPPGSWSNDQGVDISAPGGTPLLAVGNGTVVLHGIGGFGSDAPVLHLDAGPYIYYGHAGPGGAVSIGTHVRAGQQISSVGSGIVGISTGPHLEIGFCNSSGGPLGRGTAPRMHALLLAAHGG